MTNVTGFSFRSKFEKLLNDQNREIVIKAFEKVCQMTPFDAMNFIWKITYDPDEAKELFNQDAGTDEVIFSAEKIPSLRNELRFQYEQRNPDWLSLVVPDEIQAVYGTLVNHTDTLVANVVYEHCQFILNVSDQNTVDRVHYLLSNDNERLYFGGLRSLRFTSKEATYLKNYHTQISDLFKTLLDHKVDSSKNLPFVGLSALIENTQKDEHSNVTEEAQTDESVNVTEKVQTNEPANIPEEAQTNKHTDATNERASTKEEQELIDELLDFSHNKQKASAFTALTPEMILKNKEVFIEFWKSRDLNLLVEIHKLGFNLNEVMMKSEKIFTLLEAVDNL